jgi:hypothetical protein
VRTWLLVVTFAVLGATFVPVLIAACGGGGKARMDAAQAIDSPHGDASNIDASPVPGDFVMDFPVTASLTAGQTYVSECVNCTQSEIVQCTSMSPATGAVVNECEVFDESRNVFYSLNIVDRHNFAKGVLLTHGTTSDSLVIAGDNALLKVSIAMPGTIQDAAQDPTATQVWGISELTTVEPVDAGYQVAIPTKYVVSLGANIGVAGTDDAVGTLVFSTFDANTGAVGSAVSFNYGEVFNQFQINGLTATPSNGMIAVAQRTGDALLVEVDSTLTAQHIVSFGGATLNDVKLAPDNTVVVVGQASNQLFVAKLAADRTVLWQILLGGASAASVTIAADGHYLVSGIANGASVLAELDPADGTVIAAARSGTNTRGLYGEKLADGRYWWGELKNQDRWWLLTQTGTMHAVCSGSAASLTKTTSTVPIAPTTLLTQSLSLAGSSNVSTTITISGPQPTSTCSSL